MAKDHLTVAENEIFVKTKDLSMQRDAVSSHGTGGGWPNGVRIPGFAFAPRWKTVRLRADEIRRIRVGRGAEKLFGSVEAGCDEITIEAGGEPIVLRRKDEARFFDSYVERLREFARENGVTFLEA